MEQNIDHDRLEGKLNELRKLRSDWGPAAQGEIDMFEKTIARDIVRADYTEHDVTKQIVSRGRSNIVRISRQLSDNEALTELERRAYIGERRVWRWLVALLAKDYQKELGMIERLLDREIRGSREE